MLAESRPAYPARSLQRVCAFVKVDRKGDGGVRESLFGAGLPTSPETATEGLQTRTQCRRDLGSKTVPGRETRAQQGSAHNGRASFFLGFSRH